MSVPHAYPSPSLRTDPCEVMIVGEAPGGDEERQGEPFVGASGHELTRMLHEAGISRSECFITNLPFPAVAAVTCVLRGR